MVVWWFFLRFITVKKATMSKFFIGKDRSKTEFFCLEQTVDKDNIVRIIDLFVNSLSLKDLGFKTEFSKNGRPAYHPADLLVKIKLSLPLFYKYLQSF